MTMHQEDSMHISEHELTQQLASLRQGDDAPEQIPRDLAALQEVLIESLRRETPERRRKRIIISGDIPSPVNPPPGCRFHTRCPVAFDRCKVEVPAFNEYEPGHRAACHWVEEHGGKAPDLVGAGTAAE